MSRPCISLGARVAKSFQARFYTKYESRVTMEGRYFGPAITVTAIPITKAIAQYKPFRQSKMSYFDSRDSRELLRWRSRLTHS